MSHRRSTAPSVTNAPHHYPVISHEVLNNHLQEYERTKDVNTSKFILATSNIEEALELVRKAHPTSGSEAEEIKNAATDIVAWEGLAGTYYVSTIDYAVQTVLGHKTMLPTVGTFRVWISVDAGRYVLLVQPSGCPQNSQIMLPIKERDDVEDVLNFSEIGTLIKQAQSLFQIAFARPNYDEARKGDPLTEIIRDALVVTDLCDPEEAAKSFESIKSKLDAAIVEGCVPESVEDDWESLQDVIQDAIDEFEEAMDDWEDDGNANPLIEDSVYEVEICIDRLNATLGYKDA